MKKKILVISYSQTGQLTEILTKFTSPFKDVEIENISIDTQKPFPFPWSGKEFFDAMPESVLEIEAPLKPIDFKSEKYDLIIVGYQPWFLSASIPITSLFNHEGFIKLMKDTPVVTVIGARNMWIGAQESIRKRIADADGKLVANIPLIDRNNNSISAITILYWMLAGKKDRMWGIFPKPGISQKDIDDSNKFGELVYDALLNDSYDLLQERILSLGLIELSANIVFVQLRGKMLFEIWAKLILKKGITKQKRDKWLRVFKYYLLVALFIVAPIVLIFYTILIKPLTTVSIKRKKRYYCSV